MKITQEELLRAHDEYLRRDCTTDELAARYGIVSTTLLRYFRRAGLPCLKRRPRLLNDAQMSEIRRRYLAGDSLTLLAREHYLDRSTLMRYMRLVYGQDALCRRDHTLSIDRAMAKALYEAYRRPGVTLKALGERVGRDSSTIRRAFMRYGYSDYTRFKG